MLREAGIDTKRLLLRWAPYEGLDPEFVLRRLKVSLEPPPGVTLAVEDGHIHDHHIRCARKRDPLLRQHRLHSHQSS